MNFKFLIILCIIILCSNQQIDYNSSYINQKDFSLKNAIYIIRNREGNVNLEYNPNLQFTNTRANLKQNFEIIEQKNGKDNSEIFYFIKEKDKNTLLSAGEERDKLKIYSDDIDLDYALWNITPKINEENKLIYYIQNKKTKCYWELIYTYNKYYLKLTELSNNATLNQDNEFLFIELYKNVNFKNSDLLEKEPIDVLIKYIDLSDESLNRTGIHKIKKDYENGELKYSVRSILQNIPWIRYIFILMPNEKVRYFLPKEQIKEKIIYVKDKDLLGFDSENSCTFQYNLHKMRQFGLSENFILMDDDYFIAKPINKNEMFYEEDGKIYPAIITSDYYEMDKNSMIKEIGLIQRKRFSDNPHSPNGFYIRQKTALLFLYNIFGYDDIRYGKKLIEPAFSHNAIPCRLSDIEEIHKYIYDYYEYGKLILYAKERTIQDLQFQSLYWGYVKNKYDRKVSRISSEFYDIVRVYKIKSNTKKLFVINTSSRNYGPLAFKREIQILENLFPIKTKYEIDENEAKRRIDEDKNNNLIYSLFADKINQQFDVNSNDIDLSLDDNILLGKMKSYMNEQNKYIKILQEEIKFMNGQCLWQEMINFILVIFFLLLLIYRYTKSKKKN